MAETVSRPLKRPLSRLSYGLGQGTRVAWYLGHYLALRRMVGPLAAPGEAPVKIKGARPGWQGLLRAMRELFDQDWRNIDEGLYLPPDDFPSNPATALERSLEFFSDARLVDERRMKRAHSEVMTEELREKYPRYYLQNFHYQSDGWLSRDSARRYDTQVEVLFAGTADAMRRQALVPLAHALKGKDQRKQSLLDLACGNGGFIAAIKANYPRLNVTGLDLSPAYLEEARDRMRSRRDVSFIEANAESVPLPDESQDIITCVYLFHELPPKIRKHVAHEMARLLKPGGTAIILDALQAGDRPDFDGLLEFFPIGFHEPYFGSYLKTDMGALFGHEGLRLESETTALLSKVMVFGKPA
ncbi:MAG: methyltransferase domain-containing protein [Rhizobiales bacterium]|nr:methyltransferase domain-containing protein [Hyphomicrobiales bacterium]